MNVRQVKSFADPITGASRRVGASAGHVATINVLRHRSSLRVLRGVLLAVGAAALLIGLWTGLARLGVSLPGGMPQIAELHGALMICGFFGTLISLERAVALGH